MSSSAAWPCAWKRAVTRPSSYLEAPSLHLPESLAELLFRHSAAY